MNLEGLVALSHQDQISVGDEIIALPECKTSKVKSIIGTRVKKIQRKLVKPLHLLGDEIDISRGDVIANVNDRPEIY